MIKTAALLISMLGIATAGYAHLPAQSSDSQSNTVYQLYDEPGYDLTDYGYGFDDYGYYSSDYDYTTADEGFNDWYGQTDDAWLEWSFDLF